MHDDWLVARLKYKWEEHETNEPDSLSFFFLFML